MLDLFHAIKESLSRMKVHRSTHPISDELKNVIVSFLAELLKVIVLLSKFMKTNTSGAYFLLLFGLILFRHYPYADIFFSHPHQDGLRTGRRYQRRDSKAG